MIYRVSKSVIFPALLVLLISHSASATGVQYLKMPVFASSEGMGGAYTALPGNPASLYYNPAGVAFGDREEYALAAGQTNWIEGVYKRSVVLLFPTELLSRAYIQGLTFEYFDSGSMDRISEAGNVTGSFSYNDSAVGIAFGGMMGDLALAAHMRYLFGSVADHSGAGFSMDMGMIFPVADFLNFGVAINNIGGYKLEDIDVDLPFTLRAGIGVIIETFNNDYKFGLDLENDKTGTYYRLGGEYINHEGFRLRAGLNTIDEGMQYSLGTGFSSPETNWGGIFNFNYSLTGGAGLGELIHRFDFGIDLIPDFVW